jgi:hypothetical protein
LEQPSIGYGGDNGPFHDRRRNGHGLGGPVCCLDQVPDRSWSRTEEERKDLYARFQLATAQMWDSLFIVIKEGQQGSEVSGDAVTNLNQSWIVWAKTWMEMSIIASDTIWWTVEPLFNEFRTANFERRFPSEEYEEKLRELMRRELGR